MEINEYYFLKKHGKLAHLRILAPKICHVCCAWYQCVFSIVEELCYFLHLIGGPPRVVKLSLIVDTI